MDTIELRHSAAPERTLTQRLDALERANEVRTKRAALKRDLKGGRKTIVAVLTDPPAYVETAKAFDMLLATPKLGRVKVNKLLTQCRISPSKTIGGLSVRQRDELVALLSGDRSSSTYSERHRIYQRQYRAYCRGEGPAPVTQHLSR